MKEKRRHSFRPILATSVIAGVLLALLFFRAAFIAVDSSASVGCVWWRSGPRFLRGSDPSAELVRELRLALAEDVGVPGDPADVDTTLGSFDDLVSELASSMSSASVRHRHMEMKTFVRKTKAMLLKMENDVRTAKLRASIFGHLASVSIPRSLHCLTLMLAEEYAVNSGARSSLPSPEHSSRLTNDSCLHIAFLTDNVLATAVAVSSILATSSNPESLVIHIVTNKRTYMAMHAWFALNPVFPAILEVKCLHQLEWLPNDLTMVLETLEEINCGLSAFHDSKRIEILNPSASSHLNYLKIHLPEIFPKLRRVIMLDDDVIVREDLTQLWHLDLNGLLVGAVSAEQTDNDGEGHRSCIGREFEDYFNFSNPMISSSCLAKARHKCAWLGGVNIFDLQAWRRSNITWTYQHWLKKNRESGMKLWHMGSMPPALIAFDGHVKLIDPSWNLAGLGRRIPQQELLDSAAVLHFSGPMKPWTEMGIPELKRLWRRHINYSDEFIRSCEFME